MNSLRAGSPACACACNDEESHAVMYTYYWPHVVLRRPEVLGLPVGTQLVQLLARVPLDDDRLVLEVVADVAPDHAGVHGERLQYHADRDERLHSTYLSDRTVHVYVYVLI